MPPPAARQARARRANGPRSLIHEIWEEHRPIFKAVIGDSLGFLLVLTALLGSFWAIRVTEQAGYPKAWLRYMEAAHFWAYFSFFLMFLIDLGIKLFLILFRGGRS